MIDQSQTVNHRLKTARFDEIRVSAELVSATDVFVAVGVTKGDGRNDPALLVFVEPVEHLKTAHPRKFHFEKEPFWERVFDAIGELIFCLEVIEGFAASVDERVARDADAAEGLFIDKDFGGIVFTDKYVCSHCHQAISHLDQQRQLRVCCNETSATQRQLGTHKAEPECDERVVGWLSEMVANVCLPSMGGTMETMNDLPTDTRSQVAQTLNHVLAIVSDLYSQTKQAHWNVRGPLFYMQHKLFDEVAEEVQEHIDTLAERVAQLGFMAKGTVRQAAAESPLPEFPTQQMDDLDFTRALSDRFARAAAETRKAIDDCDEEGDLDSADLLTAISRDLDKSLWFLEAQFRPVGRSAKTGGEPEKFAGRGMRPAKK